MSEDKFKDRVPYEYEARVLRWIDGDTVKLSIDLGFHTRRIENCRILDYDAPEMRLYKGVSQEEKDLGIKTKEYADALVPPNSRVLIRSHYNNTGKYGRFLVQLYFVDMKDQELKDYAFVMKNEGFIKDPFENDDSSLSDMDVSTSGDVTDEGE
jgi:micrococcal nuclease